jgi:hypothetical protein
VFVLVDSGNAALSEGNIIWYSNTLGLAAASQNLAANISWLAGRNRAYLFVATSGNFVGSVAAYEVDPTNVIGKFPSFVFADPNHPPAEIQPVAFIHLVLAVNRLLIVDKIESLAGRSDVMLHLVDINSQISGNAAPAKGEMQGEMYLRFDPQAKKLTGIRLTSEEVKRAQ